jgi:hypothetical protein
MCLRRCVAAVATVTAALAVGASVASARAPIMPASGPAVVSSGCPVLYGSGIGCQAQWAIDPPPHLHFYGTAVPE